MKIILLGGTGLIGRALTEKWKGRHELYIFTRSVGMYRAKADSNVNYVLWNGKDIGAEQLTFFNGDYAVINLVGESISGLWTRKYKKRILESRVNSVRGLNSAINRAKDKPQVVIQSSAIGFYGYESKEPVDEGAQKGKGFLADVVKISEDTAKEIEGLNIRLVIIRSGVVVSNTGGFLKLLISQIKRGVTLIPGSGEQHLSWIDIDDEVNAIDFLIGKDECSGIFNLVALYPVKVKALYNDLVRIMNRKVLGKIPAGVLKLFFGKMAKELFLADQKVRPTNLLKHGYIFQYPEISTVLDKYF
ncbi:MAG: TIGR01777 family oxidoreductase [Bacteroidales bacterium]|nr:TIGR01777 family oxidoreductase [Bacteroidales bacterium]